jgi:hypothetical protein
MFGIKENIIKMRIELYERINDYTEEELERADSMNLKLRKAKYIYRRIYPRLEDIAYPFEIPGIIEYCGIEFTDETTIYVKGNYDDTCDLIDERELQAEGEHENPEES